jgi:replicative DNA helicase
MNSYDNGLPANIDAEKTILGAILLDNEAFFDDSYELQADDFSLDSNKKIYVVMNEILFGMVEGAKQVDIVTLSHELAKRRWIEDVGGVAYLASLTEGLPRRPRIEEYVRIVKDKAMLRRLMMITSASTARAADQSETALEVLGALQVSLLELESGVEGQSVSIGSMTSAVESKIRNNRQISNERTALDMSWGLKGLDEHTRGIHKGEFTVIAGESGGYKSSMLLQIMLANAKEGTPCAMFSMEMSAEQMTQRCYPMISDILTAAHVRDPRLMNAHTHIPEMEKISRILSGLPIEIDDTKQLRIDKLIARMRVLRRKKGIRLFGIDYLQLVKGMPKKPRQDAFEEIVFALRDFPTLEPDCHLIALSQYSKADGFTKSKKRSSENMFGGSIIKHAAQNIIMISVENPEKRDANDLLDAEFRIDKMREGPKGKVTCVLDRDHYRFTYMQPILK